jgi:signal transduction histidine kinase
MVEQISDAVMTAALLVLLASLIAAYFISERITGPLREMSSAAKKFAAGQFDVRVRVRGRDEVADLAIAFNEMAASLENLEKMRSSFIANVSHDLRTPMTTIAGFIDGIRDGVIPKSEQEHYLEVISVEVRRLSRLVSSLLDLSRIQAGDRKFVMKPFDICEMARIILISFEQKIEEKHLDVAFECEEDRILVNADHDAIYQVFYNICHNAVKFSRDGAAFRIRISLNREKKVQVAVYNEGQGITGEDLPLIFERFYKSDKSRGLDKSGVGLGLFISKTIMTAHGERIWVTSEEGSNCEFFFTLPRASHAHHSEDQS